MAIRLFANHIIAFFFFPFFILKSCEVDYCAFQVKEHPLIQHMYSREERMYGFNIKSFMGLLKTKSDYNYI